MLVLGDRRKTGVHEEKHFPSRAENQQQTQSTYDAGSRKSAPQLFNVVRFHHQLEDKSNIFFCSVPGKQITLQTTKLACTLYSVEAK